jgi:hypothetical protein
VLAGWLAISGGQVTTSCSEESKLPTGEESKLPTGEESKLPTGEESKLPTAIMYLLESKKGGSEWKGL